MTAASASADKPKKKASAAPAKPAKPRPTKPARPQQSIDLDKQCGVPLPNGGLCGRSLTCKTHSMGAKRAVKGRSQPYDVLLAAYHQQKHVKQAYKSAMAQLDEENEASKPLEPLTEQEEIQLVLKGVLQSQPMPLDRRVLLSSRSRQRYLQMRELLFGSVARIPTLGPSTSDAAGGLGGGAMAATGAFLGRTLIYDPVTGARFARPSRIYARRLALAQAQSQAQRVANAAQRNGTRTPDQKD